MKATQALAKLISTLPATPKQKASAMHQLVSMRQGRTEEAYRAR